MQDISRLNEGTTCEVDALIMGLNAQIQALGKAAAKAAEAVEDFNKAWADLYETRCYLSDLPMPTCAHCVQGTRDLSTVAELLGANPDAEEE